MVDPRDDLVSKDFMSPKRLALPFLKKTSPKLQYCVGRELLLLGTLAYRCRNHI